MSLVFLLGVSRAFWSSDFAYASHLARLHSLAAAPLRFGCGRPLLVVFQRFEAALALAKTKYLDHSKRQSI